MPLRLAVYRQPTYPEHMAFAHHKRMRLRLSVLIFCVVATGCRESVDKTRGMTDSGFVDDVLGGVDLVAHDGWVQLPADSDPFPEHLNDSHVCDPDGILPEDGVLEVNTNDCGYAVLGQPIAADIKAGDWVELLMYHSALASVEAPAEGHFSLWIGDSEFWGRTIDIPAAAEIYLVPIQVDWSLDAGSEARIHLHNHGGNSWRVAYLKRYRGELPQTGR